MQPGLIHDLHEQPVEGGRCRCDYDRPVRPFGMQSLDIRPDRTNIDDPSIDFDDTLIAENRPVLIYDGDCGFCRRWIARLPPETRSRVDTRPFQEAAELFPNISLEQFQASVQLVQPDGSVYEGAQAVFRTLACNPNHGWLLWMYLKVPGVALVTEYLYRLVARNRNACGRSPKGS